MNLDASITIITLFASIVGILTYWQKYVHEPKDTKQYLTQIFESARERNTELLGKLKKYAAVHNAYEDHFMQGFSFNESIQILEKCELELFTDENLTAIQKSRGTGQNTEALIDGIKKHDAHVSQSLTHFHYLFPKK